MARHTTNNKWLSAVLTINAATGTTTLTFPELVGRELERRVGASGNLTRWFVNSGSWTSATVSYTGISYSGGNASVTLSAAMSAGDTNTANILAFTDVNTTMLLPIPGNDGILCSSSSDTQWGTVPYDGIVLTNSLLPTASSAAVRRSFANFIKFRNGDKVPLTFDTIIRRV